MAEPTKAERSEAAKKAAATRAENEARESAGDLRKALDHTAQAVKHLGLAGAEAAKKTATAVTRRSRAPKGS